MKSLFYKLTLIGIIIYPTLACGSVRLPQDLTFNELKQVKLAKMPLVVGVQNSAGEFLLRTLQQSNMFSQVDYVDQLLIPPDLIAKYEGRCNWHRGGWVPVLPIISLGVIPQGNKVAFGYSFSLFKPEFEQHKITFKCRDEGYIIVGWLGTAMSMSKKWTIGGNPEESQAFYDRTALAIANQQQYIHQLLQINNNIKGENQ